jgi:hypothetical protein
MQAGRSFAGWNSADSLQITMQVPLKAQISGAQFIAAPGLFEQIFWRDRKLAKHI